MAERPVQIQEFWLFDHGAVYLAPGLMAVGGSHLSQRGEWILAQELAGLTERFSDWVWRGKGIKPGLLLGSDNRIRGEAKD